MSERRLPTVADIIGIAPDFTGGLPSDVYVRQMRGGSEADTLPGIHWQATAICGCGDTVMFRQRTKIGKRLHKLGWQVRYGQWMCPKCVQVEDAKRQPRLQHPSMWQDSSSVPPLAILPLGSLAALVDDSEGLVL